MIYSQETRIAEDVGSVLGLGPGPVERTRVSAVSPGTLKRLRQFAIDCLSTPAAMNTNTRLLDNGYETPKARWSSSRFGEGEVIHTEFDGLAVDEAISAGQMLVIDSVDDQHVGLMRVRERLEYLLSARMWTNLYLTGAERSVFKLHTDTHDTLIVQLAGQRVWQVGEYSEGGDVDTYSAPRNQFTMSPGSVLAMAGRTAHNVTGMGDISLHLTLGFDREAAVPWLLRPVADLLSIDPPRLSAQDLELAKARLKQRRRGTTLPFVHTRSLNDVTFIKWASRLRPVVEVLRPDYIQLISMGGSYSFSGHAVDLIQQLITGSEICVNSWLASSNVDKSELSESLHQLATSGLILIR